MIKNKYALLTYLHQNRPRNTEVSSVFQSIYFKTRLLSKHLNFALELYEKDFLLVKENLKTKEKLEFEEAKKRYKFFYEEYGNSKNEEDERLRDLFASHESGVDEIEYRFQTLRKDEEMLFLEYIDIFNKSLLITLYAGLEGNLKKIVNLCTKLYPTEEEDMDIDSRKYLSGFYKYIKKNLGLEINQLEFEYSKIMDIAFIRNQIVHNLSIIPPAKFKKAEGLINQFKEMLELEDIGGEQFLIIKETDFVEKFLSNMKSFYLELFWLIDQKSNFEFLRTRISYILDIISNDFKIGQVFIERKRLKSFTAICQISSEKLNMDNEFYLFIEIKRGKFFSFKSKIETEYLQEGIEFINSNQEFIFKDLFKLYNFGRKEVVIKMEIR